MRAKSKSSLIKSLATIRDEFRAKISGEYEIRAQPCAKCMTPGICCTDRHFVNVEISELEAEAIYRSIQRLDPKLQARIFGRVDHEAKILFSRSTGKYSCPLFEAGIGCTVHETAKPLPCIFYSCYHRSEDLPPDGLLESAEKSVALLNRLVYLRAPKYRPIPIALLDRFQAAAEQRRRDDEQKECDVIPNGQILPNKDFHDKTNDKKQNSQKQRCFSILSSNKC